MLILIIAGVVFFLAVLCFARGQMIKAEYPANRWNDAGVDLLIVVVIVFLMGFIVSGAGWVNQVSDLEDIKKFQKIETIYQAKAKVLTAEFAKHLAKTYPEYEKDIYDKISPDKVDLYFVAYPELRASEALVALVDRINKLQSDIYDQRIKAEQMFKNIRFRLRNPWLLRFMIPAK